MSNNVVSLLWNRRLRRDDMAFTQLEQTFKVNPVSPAVEYLFFTPFLEDVSLGRFQRSHQSESLIRY